MHELPNHDVPEQDAPPHLELVKHPRVREEFLRKSHSELVAHLKEQYPSLTDAIWHQLQILDQPSVEARLKSKASEKPDSEPQTHLAYELEMVKVVLAYQEHIEEFIFGNDKTALDFGTLTILPDDLISRLVFMIMVSDIGKAGSYEVEEGGGSPILDIYTHVIMDATRHGEWLKNNRQHEFPPELEAAVAYLRQNPSVEQQVFTAGNFGLAPIRLALYCAEQVFANDFPNAADERRLFQVTDETIHTLNEIGIDINTTYMRDFWTFAHLFCGELFSQGDAVHTEDKSAAVLAFMHHNSQGARPQLSDQMHFDDPRTMKLIAITEYLDKADANIHRSHKKDLSAVTVMTENMVMPGMLIQNGHDTSRPHVQAYADTWQFIQKSGMLDALFGAH